MDKNGLERWTGDWVVLGWNPTAATSLRNFGNSVYPALPVSFEGDNKIRRSLLSGVYARGSKRSHQSALQMCNLSWTPPPPLRDHTPSWTTLEISLATSVCYSVHVVFQIISNQIKPTQHGISKNGSSPNCSRPSVCVNLMQSIKASRKSIPPIPTVVFVQTNPVW